MRIEELCQGIHGNAVLHGWWDGERTGSEILALIHSEWSEALEEARNNMPLVYIWAHTGSQRDPEDIPIVMNADGRFISPWGEEYRGGKPEGAAVELIDGVIRILDVACDNCTFENDGKMNPELKDVYTQKKAQDAADCGLSRLIAKLHAMTARGFDWDGKDSVKRIDFESLLAAAVTALAWVDRQGIDAEKLLAMKHEYNKGRPYRHGKKF